MSQQILPLEMESILKDIRQAIDMKLYYPAVLSALTVPDICSALALPNNEFVKEKHYSQFVDKYATKHGIGISGIDCYRLRGGVVHRSSFARHPKFGATHVIFTIPETAISVHSCTARAGDKSALIFDLVTFCKAMDCAARAWYADNKTNLVVKENLQHLVRYCPFGLPPFLGGAPVVASGP